MYYLSVSKHHSLLWSFAKLIHINACVFCKIKLYQDAVVFKVITKPFQGNQLAPHMLTTAQGKQVLQGSQAGI